MHHQMRVVLVGVLITLLDLFYLLVLFFPTDLYVECCRTRHASDPPSWSATLLLHRMRRIRGCMDLGLINPLQAQCTMILKILASQLNLTTQYFTALICRQCQETVAERVRCYNPVIYILKYLAYIEVFSQR